MPSTKISSDKIFVKKLLEMWFRIPSYQRAYVWGKDQVYELLDDLTYAQTENKFDEYFLGSIVLRRQTETPLEYEEYEVLDGQQRLTTILLLLAVIRDLFDSPKMAASCQKCLCQEEDVLLNVPGRFRLESDRGSQVQKFFKDHVEKVGGTLDKQLKQKWDVEKEDKSARNMALVVLELQAYLKEYSTPSLIELTNFLLNQVLLIYVATEDMNDAFRLFTILNNRGMPLRNSDILKAQNLGKIADSKRTIYAKDWEDMESELGDDLDRFLAYVRTILVKDKARYGLTTEFRTKIFGAGLVEEGKPFLDLLFKYFQHYQHLLINKQGGTPERRQFDNLISLMQEGLPGTDWVPPLLAYYNKFKMEGLLTFLEHLDNKVSADLMTGVPPTSRIENMNTILKAIDNTKLSTDINNHEELFAVDQNDLYGVLNGKMYGRRFTKYVLLKLSYLKLNHDLTSLNVSRAITIEHILPQNPEQNSQWTKDFTPEQREELVHKIGNLVLLGRGKNASLGRHDFVNKTTKYFKGYLSVSPHMANTLHNKKTWHPSDITSSQQESVKSLLDHYFPN
ncbi:DUF262 domain-containing protein [Hymenobacter cavernae]|uniref:DUF262 domain-containing protein n=1 Tax=Hymenobacter cavernae TaxID=2044852 RepID=A0ABQ1UV99_9BACT|nr:DUF262 domain-containing protein [Hymenobacter cavernae]GGF27450.1 hypothetical protein GCM10011383_43910 [Hymenobacter cavernae]